MTRFPICEFRILGNRNKRSFFPRYRNLMCADMKEETDGYCLEVELPGFQKEDINLNLEGEYLVVSVERKHEVNDEDPKGKFLHRERYYGKFQRRFYVGALVEDDIRAKYEDGVLKVFYPKKAEERIQKNIEIK